MHSAQDDQRLAREWLGAISRDEVRAQLESVYAAAADAIARRGPACWASGRCCNFEKTGHLLYVTGLEAAYTVWTGHGRSEPPPPPNAAGGLVVLNNPGGATPGACPFQAGNLCTVHMIKPLGCRVYFCDRSAQQWQNDLSELLLAEIRAIHQRWNIEYRYGEWRGMLRMLG